MNNKMDQTGKQRLKLISDSVRQGAEAWTAMWVPDSEAYFEDGPTENSFYVLDKEYVNGETKVLGRYLITVTRVDELSI